ncbi:MAG: hypothetical protein AAFO96_06740 [Bacteroidota bacterium]
MFSDNIGLARFGKFDGFEIKQLQGNLLKFQGEEAQQVLVQALQLRLEHLRIFEEAAIWGFSLIQHQDDQYRCFSLYRYTLDAYRRDGYQAISLVTKNGVLSAPTIHHALHSLIQLPSTSPLPISNTWEQEFMPAPPLPAHLPHLPAFIPLGDATDRSAIQFLRGMITLTMMPYGYFFASHGERTMQSLEVGKFYLYQPQAIATTKEEGVEEKIPRQVSSSSLVHAFDQDSIGSWKTDARKISTVTKKKPKNKKWWQNLL